MKRLSFILILSILLLFAFGFSACSEENHDHSNATTHSEETTGPTASQTGLSQSQTQQTLTAYLQVKDALVATDATATATAAKEMAESLAGITEVAEIQSLAQQIGASEDVAIQREIFNSLSQQVYALAKEASALETKLYKQYCPMAFNNTGAYWLAAESEVNNPYFGDMMLHCGKVEEEL